MADHPELVSGPYLQKPPLSVRTPGLFERSRGLAETFDVKDLFSRVAPNSWNQFLVDPKKSEHYRLDQFCST